MTYKTKLFIRNKHILTFEYKLPSWKHEGNLHLRSAVGYIRSTCTSQWALCFLHNSAGPNNSCLITTQEFRAMASFLHSWSFNFLMMAMLVTIFGKSISGYAPVYQPSPWSLAHATFYGDETASATMGMWLITSFLATLNSFICLVFMYLMSG